MKKNVKNLPEFKALIERYKTITLEEIEGAFERCGYLTAKNELTGFGQHDTCTLCKKLGVTGWVVDCTGCVFSGNMGCIKHKTYRMVADADAPAELLAAYRARAAYMETLLK